MFTMHSLHSIHQDVVHNTASLLKRSNNDSHKEKKKGQSINHDHERRHHDVCILQYSGDANLKKSDAAAGDLVLVRY